MGVTPLPCSPTPNLGHIWGNFQGRKPILGDNWCYNPLSRVWGENGVGEGMDKFWFGREGVMSLSKDQSTCRPALLPVTGP